MKIDYREAPHVICQRFLQSNILPGQSILDVGCGNGELMLELERLQCAVVGVEIDETFIATCQSKNLKVKKGFAENLPFPDRSFDRIVCSVVVPYTDEKQAVTEWSRVLKEGGKAYVTYHGIGYGIYYALKGASIKQRLYGLKMLVNTMWYGLTGKKLPGALGDTLCQVQRRLNSYYTQCGLVLEQEVLVDQCGGLPRFFCHKLSNG